MKKTTAFVGSVLVFGLLTGCATVSGPAPAMMKDGMLVNTKGITLYVYDSDLAGSGKSACNDDCAVKWPALMPAAGDKAGGDFAIITRDDGKKQWSYKGKPLYTWPEDQEPGDKYGDNYNKVWHVVTPQSVKSSVNAAAMPY
jgi:predicted lipoprotein with Yx(FWY)xxD motif